MSKTRNEPQYDGLPMGDIQANILKPHGRRYTWCLFLQFSGPDEAVRRWISNFAENERIGITSAKQQCLDSQMRKKNSQYDGGILTGFYLSNLGYQRLGYYKDRMPGDLSFQKGMRNGSINAALKDIPSGYWERGFQRSIHGMIMLADGFENRLADRKTDIEKSLCQSGAGRCLFTERGEKLINAADGRVVEHFDYVDGISQPQFWDEYGNLLEENWRIVLTEEEEGRFGSYLVFRKLEQNVKAFYEKLEVLAETMKISQEYAGAQIIGRFKDGTPLTLARESNGNPTNDFDYSKDMGGSKCPFHSHIRKTNPRDDAVGSDHRKIVRRGVPYGERLPDLSDRPAKGCGLLFMCFQASIVEQFEFLMKKWCNNRNFPPDSIVKDQVGLDPVAGQMILGSQHQHWNKGWEEPHLGTHKFDFRKIIQLKGGRYFYAPSISFLTNLKFGRKKVTRNFVSSSGNAIASGFSPVGIGSLYRRPF